MKYDAILVVSFGGPEQSADVMPFLENVLRGKNVPRERVLEVAEHYNMLGGKSPINEQNRQLISALEAELSEHGPQLPVYWGNRNWHPLLPDTLRQMEADGVQRALAFVTSAYSSYSSCRQYQEDIARAREEVGAGGAPVVDKIRVFYNHPEFIEASADRIRRAFEQIPPQRRPATQLIFTAHSIPLAMAAGSPYQEQLRESARLAAEQAGHSRYRLVYQSRSGPPSQPWLEPDILDGLREIKRDGASDVVIAPIGFVSDHMEVIFDLDIQARQLCEELGLNMVRAPTVGTHPRVIRMIRELICERLDESAPRLALGSLGARPDVCAADCCPMPRRPETPQRKSP